MRNAYEILVRNTNGKRLLGRTRCRWEDNIETYSKGKGFDGVEWTQQPQDRVQ
jgi:hypothetical protein